MIKIRGRRKINRLNNNIRKIIITNNTNKKINHALIPLALTIILVWANLILFNFFY
tara:strand:- start:142 stop:309 length:168 start_codon:yes stop_codon:yes gene_type:complete